MRVLHATQPTTGGVARCVGVLARHQLAAGLTPIVAAPPSPFSQALAADGVTTVDWQVDREFDANLKHEAKGFQQLLSQSAPDVVHLHSTKASFLGRMAIRGRIPTAVHPHAWSFYAATAKQVALARFAERRLSHATDLIMVTGSTELVDGLRAGVKGPMRNVSNGVDPTTFRPPTPAERAAVRRCLGFDDGDQVAVLVGRLCEQKGQLPFVKAWVNSDTASHQRLVLVGDGPDRAAIEAAADESVTLLGFRDDVDQVMRAADVYVQSSRWEGLSLSLLEAMSMNLRIAASAAGSTIDALGSDDHLTAIGDDAALIELTCKQLAAGPAADSMNRERIEQRFDEASWAASVTALTTGLVASH